MPVLDHCELDITGETHCFLLYICIKSATDVTGPVIAACVIFSCFHLQTVIVINSRSVVNHLQQGQMSSYCPQSEL